MLAVTLIVSCLLVCGFYGYVLLQLQREHKRLNAHKKRLPEHLYEVEPEPEETAEDREEDSDLCSRAATSPKANARVFLRRRTLIDLGFSAGGMAALFAGIKLFSSLVTWLHWN
jgi:hypothetical protein